MLIIGSNAAVFNKIHNGEEPRDVDLIGTFDELQALIRAIKEDAANAGSRIQLSVPLDENHWHIRDHTGWNYEFEIAWPGSSGEALLKLEGNEEHREGFATKEACLALKLSHRYKKDSPHFLKTMQDIRYYRALGITLTPELEHLWMPQREAETYVYNHPKLDVSKGEFFSGDGVRYVYDHDSIHETVAILQEWKDGKIVQMPAYTLYMKDGAQVMTDKEKFFLQEEKIRLYGVYEEACVLALERSQIPFDFKPLPRYSFEKALMKVCTSITSGYFREYAWENYEKVLDLYNRLGHNDYIERFKENQHLLKPFKQEDV
jgi:hypothetical protein